LQPLAILVYTNEMLTFTEQQGVTIIELGASYESLDEAALEELGGVLLTKAVEADPPCLLLDLAKTRFIGSSFIELLVRAWKRLTARGGSMALCCVKPFCSEVIHVTRLDTLWEMFPSRDQAISSLAGREETCN
jgi:anti-sigma B factor antagonist